MDVSERIGFTNFDCDEYEETVPMYACPCGCGNERCFYPVYRESHINHMNNGILICGNCGKTIKIKIKAYAYESEELLFDDNGNDNLPF